MRVTIDLPDEILRGIRKLAQEENLELNAAVVAMLQRQLQTGSMPVEPETESQPVIGGLTQSDVNDILAHAEEESHGLFR